MVYIYHEEHFTVHRRGIKCQWHQRRAVWIREKQEYHHYTGHFYDFTLEREFFCKLHNAFLPVIFFFLYLTLNVTLDSFG